MNFGPPHQGRTIPRPAALCAAVLAVALGVAAGDARAQDGATTEHQPPALAEPTKDWTLAITPYIWIPGQDGRVTVKNTTVDVDLSVADTFDTIVDDFNAGLCLHAEFSRERFTIFGDVMYLRLETQDVRTDAGLVDVQQAQGIFELGAAYAVIDRSVGTGKMRWKLEPLVGMRVHYFTGELNIEGPDNDRDSDRTWVDGFVGLRTRFSFNDTIALVANGNIGAGESDFTWSALAAAEISFTPRASLMLGYRALDDDYSTGEGDDRFVYDVLLHGPFVAFTLRF